MRKRKGSQRLPVTDWINTVCNVILALAAVIGLVYMIVNQ